MKATALKVLFDWLLVYGLDLVDDTLSKDADDEAKTENNADKMIGLFVHVLEEQVGPSPPPNNLTSPRFWAAASTSFFASRISKCT